MPTISLPPPPPDGLGLRVNSIPILAAMLFPQPRHAEKRREWCACTFAQSYIAWRDAGAPDGYLANHHIWIPHLWEVSQAPRRIADDGLRRSQRAMLSGEVLRHQLVTTHHHPRHRGVERAKAFINWRNQRYSKPTDRKAPSSESLIEKAWAEFRPASHLWLAFAETLPPGGDRTDADWIEMLAFAEGVLMEAEELGLVPAGEGWRAPAEVQALRVATSPLAPDLLAWLDREFPA